MNNQLYDDMYLANYRSKLDGYEFARWKALDHLLKNVVKIEEPKKVLDYGSGSGLHIDLWKNIFPEAELFFAEISSVALDQLAEKYPEYKGNVQIITDDRTAFGDNSFDAILSVEVMEHVEDLQAYIKEIHRILKPGGFFIWTTPCGNSFSVEHVYSFLTFQIDKTKEGFRRWRWEAPSHVRRLKTSEIEKILLEIGFSKVGFKFRAHLFSFLCSKLGRTRIFPRKLLNRAMELDYKFFRNYQNGASMIGYARK